LSVQGLGSVTEQTESADLSAAELAAWRGMLRVHASLMRSLDADLSLAHGIGLRSYEVLLHLDDAPGRRLRMSGLCGSVLLSASGVSRLVDRLERDGLVRRERCSEDGRGFWAVLTPAGHERLAEARPTHLAGVRRLFLSCFADADLARLARYWDRILPGATAARPPRGAGAAAP
jgi:DNA-binding MarR family transcriptional regulator